MFELAIVIGIYSYLLFALGVLHLIYPLTILPLSVIVFYFLFRLFKDTFKLPKIRNWAKEEKLIISLISLFAIINLIGVLSPEFSFDALWYHLTLPKIYIQDHAIKHISGGLLYYSNMPKLIDLTFIPALMFGNEILAKFIHFLFGILCCIALYKCSKIFLGRTFSLLVVLIFYSNIAVAWLSTVAYIDLGRTFFEIMAFWGVIKFIQKKQSKWLDESAVMLGLAISSKLLAIGSLPIFLAMIVFILRGKNFLLPVLRYSLITILIVSPWFVFSFFNTGNFFYPFFTSIYPIKAGLDLNIGNFLWQTFVFNQDKISPIYVLILPLYLMLRKKFNAEEKLIALYVGISILILYITPKTGGGRFLIAYLPVFSLFVVLIIKHLDRDVIKRFCIFLIFAAATTGIVYRTSAEIKYFSYLLGKESKQQFLSKHLNFKFGDFYDTDGYFANNITQKDKILLYGFHNLYYANFPFLDSSWVKKGDTFNYVAVQNAELPKRFSSWDIIYQNQTTGVKLYTLNKTRWIY